MKFSRKFFVFIIEKKLFKMNLARYLHLNFHLP